MNKDYSVHDHGVQIVEDVVSDVILKDIKEAVLESKGRYPSHGIRNAEKKFESIKQLVNSERFIKLALMVLGEKPDLVRAIFFDKTPENNWLVSWHQDKTITLNRKLDVQGWGPWSIKDGIHHVQPSLDVLRNMLTFRLHLDDADKHNGCLKIIPKTHNRGILNQKQIADIVNSEVPYLCEAKAGDLLMMHPLVLHSSSKSQHPGHRRVLHVEYSNYKLPAGLVWA